MAKRCLDKIIVDGVDYPLMQLNDFSIFNNYTGWDTNCSNAGYSYISSYGSDIMAIGGDRWISYGEHKYWDIENSNDAFIGLIGFNRNVSTKNICFDENDLDCRTRNSYVSSNQNMNMWCTIIVDDETELGFAIIVRQFPNGGTKDAWIYNDSNNDYAYCKKIYQCFGNVAQKITSNGGGATHIAKVTGQLKDLSSNLSDILMVSGGGGGGYLVGDGSINPDYVFSGANQTFATTNSTTEGNRPFVKENAGDAIAFMYYESTSTWYGPALISKIENATYFNIYNQYFQRDSVSAVIDGETWYVSKPGLWCHYPDSNPNWNLPVLRGHDYTTDWVLGNEISASNVEKLIRKVLQLAKGIYEGEEAGGMQGSGSNSGTQSTGNAFGQGESADDNSCGGGGYYGGYKRGNNIGAGAGSGYIGYTYLSNKKMVGYDVLTSDTDATKTVSVLVHSSKGLSDYPKSGNGKAKITFIRNRNIDVISDSNEVSIPSQSIWGTNIGCSKHFEPSTNLVIMGVKIDYGSDERFFFQSRLGAMLSTLYPSDYGVRANVKNCVGSDQDAEWLLAYGKNGVSYNAMTVDTTITVLQVEGARMLYETFTKSVTYNATESLKSIELTKGKWIIVCSIQYQSDSLRYFGRIVTGSEDLASQSGYDSSGWVACNLATVVEINAATTYSLESICSKNCTVTGFIKAIQLD